MLLVLKRCYCLCKVMFFCICIKQLKKKIFTNISTARCTILTEFEPEKQINKYSHVKSSNPTL